MVSGEMETERNGNKKEIEKTAEASLTQKKSIEMLEDQKHY